MANCHILLLGIARIIRTVTFFQNELVDNIFDHQYQTPYPEDIDNDIVFVLQPETQQRPSDEDDVLHVVEKEDTCAVNLFEYALHTYPSKLGVPSGICSIFSRLASCSAS